MEEWEQQYQLSVGAPVQLVKALLEVLKSDKARVINVASTLALKPIPDTSAYSAMKAAMVNWTQGLAIELADSGVLVNCICPGIIDTPIHGQSPETKDDWNQQVSDFVPLGRAGKPEDVAELVGFYAKEENSWMTGNVHVVDGGLHLR